jgi:PKD repeat protein
MFCHINKIKGVILLFVLLLFLFNLAMSETATIDEMKQVCRNWLSGVVNSKGAWAGSIAPQIAHSEEIIVNDTIVGYYFEINPSGFIIVPRLKEMVPVKLYSDNGKLDLNDKEGFAGLVKDVLSAQTTQFAVLYGDLSASQPAQGEVLFDRGQRVQWEKYLTNDKAFKAGLASSKSASSETIGPLIATHWNQSAPYNNYCPVGYNGQRTVVGCVATAAAQIMAYHQWPLLGNGSLQYYWQGDVSCGGSTPGKYLTANFSDPFDWPNIPPTCSKFSPIEQQNAVAELCYDVGIAFTMSYGVCGSGAYVAGVAPGIYHNYFRYKESVRSVYRSNYDYLEWMGLIKNEIIANRPIQYQIYSHSIICDGYQDDLGLAQMHMNYGWGGTRDAWYLIDGLYCPWAGCDYIREDMVIGIEPDRRAYLLTDTSWGFLPLTVNFDGFSSFESVDNWIWNFGDGDSSLMQSPTHVYENGGRHTVTLKTISGADTGIYIANNYIAALNDSLIGNNTQGLCNSTVEVVINGHNIVPLKRLVIPVTFAGPLNLQFVDYSIAGCRTEYFDYVSQPSFDGDNSRTTFILENSNPRWDPDLAPGSGPLIKLYFSIPSSARQNQTATIGFTSYSSYTPVFIGNEISYTPILTPGVISLAFMCGDADHSGFANLLDVSYLINNLYRGGPAPVILQAADSNGDGKISLLDVSYLINYLYRSGPALMCHF